MKSIVFDIETVGVDFESLDEISQNYFLKFADSEQKKQEVNQSLSFYPLTAKIIAIAMLEVETQKGAVYFENRGKENVRLQEQGIHYISATEKEILLFFWRQLRRYDQFVTFNGRIFDCPFIMLRSAMHQIRAEKNLMPYRYNSSIHIDLADQLSFYDALRRKFPLHMWCKAFGIPSSKEDGICGLEVKEYYQNERYLDIARYCLKDVRVTKDIYLAWKKCLSFSADR